MVLSSQSKLPTVFPTRVGVNRALQMGSLTTPSFPHPRGGEPFKKWEARRLFGFSPPAWG